MAPGAPKPREPELRGEISSRVPGHQSKRTPVSRTRRHRGSGMRNLTDSEDILEVLEMSAGSPGRLPEPPPSSGNRGISGYGRPNSWHTHPEAPTVRGCPAGHRHAEEDPGLPPGLGRTDRRCRPDPNGIPGMSASGGKRRQHPLRRMRPRSGTGTIRPPHSSSPGMPPSPSPGPGKTAMPCPHAHAAAGPEHAHQAVPDCRSPSMP
jgi:hypothetical protein